MTNLIMQIVEGPETAVFGNYGLWLFLSVGAVSLFVIFIPLITWIDSRRKEREAFYKAETFRRLAESTTDGAKSAVELLREEGRQEQIRKREGMKIGGVITLAVGVALSIFLRAMTGGEQGAPWLCGLIPAMIGASMLVYVYFLAAPVE
jgi:hypothetical protein